MSLYRPNKPYLEFLYQNLAETLVLSHVERNTFFKFNGIVGGKVDKRLVEWLFFLNLTTPPK